MRRIINPRNIKPKIVCILLTMTALIMGYPVMAQFAGEIWGMTNSGGAFGMGVIFKAGADGTNIATLHDFTTVNPGAHPRCSLTEAPDGKLYGFSSDGGPYNPGAGFIGAGGIYNGGVLFEYDIMSNGYTKRHDFKGGPPIGKLVLATNSKLYGITAHGGANNNGVIFEFDPVTKIYLKKFDLPIQSFPEGLIQASNGKLYGLMSAGGTSSSGVLFSFDIGTGTYNIEVNFDNVNGSGPSGTLLEASNGKLYGVTAEGGTNGNGTLFEYDPASKVFIKKINFLTSTGSVPVGPMVEGSPGVLQGVTSNGGLNGGGVIYDYVISSGNFTRRVDLIFSLRPQSGLMKANNGFVYGVSSSGGAFGQGVMFQYDPVGFTYTNKYDFSIASGRAPRMVLTQASNNKLYGTATHGGQSDFGVIFEYDLSLVTYSKKLELQPCLTGGGPRGALFQSSWGKVYGATTFGGMSGGGTLFELDLVTGIPNVLVNFTSALGSGPDGGLVELNGMLFGVAQSGGVNSGGTIYSYDPISHSATKLVDFTSPNGESPNRALVLINNKLYGTTRKGGANNQGALFEYDPGLNNYTKKYDFALATSIAPRGLMVLASNGKLYGTTGGGGANSLGVLFEFDVSLGLYTTKFNFSTVSGYSNYGPMAASPDGKIYGVTGFGGNSGLGTIFEFDIITNTFLKKYDFTVNSGSASSGGLLLTATGKLYGASFGGGSDGLGTFFEFDLISSLFSKKADFAGLNGANPDLLTPIQVGKSQTVTFNSIPVKTYGNIPFTLTASSSSGLAVSFTSSDPTIASISGTVVNILKAGVVNIIANQTGNALYIGASQTQSLTINKGNQTIDFSSIPIKKVSDVSFDLPVSASSGLSLAYQSSNPGVATISGHTVTIVSVGTTNITATQIGDGNYNAAPSITQTLSVVAITGLDKIISELIAYPNPVSDTFIVQLPSNGHETSLTIYSIEGRMLEKRTSNLSEEHFSTSNLATGYYFLKIENGNSVKWVKFLKS